VSGRGVARPLVVLALVLALVPVGAATAAAAPGRGSSLLTLESHSLVIPPDGTIELRVLIPATVPDGARIQTTVHARLSEPGRQVRAVLDGADPGPVLLSRRDTLASLERAPAPPGSVSGAWSTRLRIPTVTERAGSVPGENARLAQAGSYPVRLSLRTADTTDELTVFVVRSPAAPAAEPPVPVAMVVPVSTPPTMRPDGSTVVPDTARSRLAELDRLLSRWPTAAMTVAVSPELLDGLRRTGRASDATLVESLRSSLGAREVLSRPYVRLDPSTAAAEGLDAAFSDALTRGEDLLAAEIGARPVRTTWVAEDPITPSGFALLRSRGTRQVVASGSLFVDEGDDRLPGTVSVVGAGSNVPVLVADPGLLDRLDPSRDSVLGAHHLVAELLGRWLDTAAGAAPTGAPVVLAFDSRWTPDPNGTDTLLRVLTDPAVAPFLRLTPLSEAARSVPVAIGPDGLAVTRTMASAVAREGFAGLAERLAALQSFADAASSLRTGSPVDTEPLRIAVSSDLTATERDALLANVQRESDGRLAVIEELPRRTVTLGGDTASIPITVRSRVPYPVRVRIRLESPRLSFPANDEVITVDGTWQGRVPVVVRANGTTPVTIALLTPDGDVEVGRGQLEVRALGLSGLGVLLSGGAILVLAAWWLQHNRSRRRRAGTLTP
jgi:hypothetical protein